MGKDIFKTKTFWTCLAGLIGAIGGASTGEMESGTAITVGINALIGMFLREAIAKK